MNGFIENLKTKIRLIVGKALITAAKESSDGDGLAVDVTLAGGETHTDMPFLQHYGLSTRPNKNAEAIVLFIGGARDNGVAIASRGDSSKMPSIEDGEVALYSEFGQTIILKKDGSIVATPKSGKAYRIESDVEVTGDLKVLCDGSYITMQNHIHPTPVGASSAPTPGI